MSEDLKPGRELDALIAEKVMGASREAAAFNMREYSTDIAAAWQVVEKMDELGFPNYVISGKRTGYTACCTFWKHDEPYGAEWESADTPAHAICLAALRAMEGRK